MVQHIGTTNDTNGNPRRAWVYTDHNGRVVDVVDEGYSGRPAILRTDPGAIVEMPYMSVTPKCYRNYVKMGQALAGKGN